LNLSASKVLASGWLNGSHPTSAGDLVDRTVCFEWDGNPCMWETEVKIRHCKNYFLYYLMDAPICSARYCTVSMNSYLTSR